MPLTTLLLHGKQPQEAASLPGRCRWWLAALSRRVPLLAAGVETCRTSAVGGEPRAPYCLMGVCFECLVTVDGVGNQQGCLVPLRPGMKVETQIGRGKRELAR